MTPEEIEILTCADPAPEQTASQFLQSLYARRRANLLAMFHQYGCPSKVDLARLVGSAESTMAAYLNGKADIPEKRARVIEYVMRLPFGALDKEAI